MPLDTQIQILSVDTGNFYYPDEAYLHKKNMFVRVERRKLINGYNIEIEDENKKKHKEHQKGTKEIIAELAKKGYTEKAVNKIVKESDTGDFSEYDDSISCLLSLYANRLNAIKEYADEAKSTKSALLELLSKRTNQNIEADDEHKKLRVLNESSILDKEGNIYDKNIISVFSSSFTRMIGAEPDKLTYDFMVIQVYYFDVIKDLIYNGFLFKGDKYIYFTSSAGQIRTKKCVFVKESVWKKYEKTIMCGLTIDDINAKGGNNTNKHLAYLALSNSATDEWEEFDIDKTIVIDDFETQVFGTYDFIDDKDYSIQRMSGYVPITHTDGAGMILPNAFGKKQKNMMVRLPFVKGLLGIFDFVKFIQVHGCSSVIKDIYGVEHDVIAEDIQVIFTKSQSKLWKYYKNWDDYKTKYKKYNCTAGFTNKEEDRIRNATINYQMLQSLTDITDDEIKSIAEKSNKRLKNICSSVKNIQDAFGATVYNTYKTDFQKAIIIYPELLNDEFIRIKLKTVKDSLVKKYKSGKLQINGKYTFLLPDFYAACQYWFQDIKQPQGLLQDGEVFCWLFRLNDKLDCLRSPHLYMEHSIRKNLAYRECGRQLEIREWFCTDAVYTSSHDLISKILQFDDH